MSKAMPAVPAIPAKMAAPAAGVKVRRVRQGSGDCFLLAFPTRGPRPLYVLIDCGALASNADAGETTKKVEAGLHEATGGKIDVLVATLEPQGQVFDTIEIGQVWAAWTEDSKDPAARRSGRGDSPRYLKPGDRPELPGLEGARVYVLGSPGVESPQVAKGDEGPKTQSFPFDLSYRVPMNEARRDPFFQASYFGVAGPHSERETAWRQIETEWLTSASPPSSPDSEPNPSGLALAFELVPSGKVLLFAAGARTDDWLAGSHLHWPRQGDTGDPELPATPVTVAELLHRTVLYQVGHPASQGPLETGGLELMTDPELVVMLPEDEGAVAPDYVELTIAEAAGEHGRARTNKD